MKNLLNKHKLLLIYLGIIFLISLLATTLEYIGLPYLMLTTIIKILNYFLIFIYTYKNAKNCPNKGYYSGIKCATKIIILMLFINIIFIRTFVYKSVINYMFILLISVLGGIIGKNKQEKLS